MSSYKRVLFPRIREFFANSKKHRKSLIRVIFVGIIAVFVPRVISEKMNVSVFWDLVQIYLSIIPLLVVISFPIKKILIEDIVYLFIPEEKLVGQKLTYVKIVCAIALICFFASMLSWTFYFKY